MTLTLQHRLELVGSAVALGLLGDLLLRTFPWGLNAALWMALLALATGVLLHRWRSLPSSFAWGLPLALTGMGLLFLWRADGMLGGVTTLAVLAVFGTGVQYAQRALHSWTSGLGLRAVGWIRCVVHAWLRLPLAVLRSDWDALSRRDAVPVSAVGRGLFLATPIVTVFLLLLGSADATFASWIEAVIDVDGWTIIGHLFWTGVFTATAGGFLRGVVRRLDVLPDPDASPRVRLGWIETSIVLGLVAFLFLAFTGSQLPYYFGGHEIVLQTRDLTVAEYARRGFFELVLVAALDLGLLWTLSRVYAPDGPVSFGFQGLAGLHLFLVFGLLVSAAQRMWLYQSTYGLTEMRLFVSVFLVWLVFVLGWFAWTVLRDRSLRFLPGISGAGLVFVLALHVGNPEQRIAEVNLARAAQGHDFDEHYNANLGADAAPTLLSGMTSLPIDDQRPIARELVVNHLDPVPLLSWNWSRARAHRLVTDRRDMLCDLASPFLASIRKCTSPTSSNSKP